METEVLRIENDSRVSLSLKRFSVEIRSAIKDEEALKDDIKILNDISFDLESGSLMAIMGGSGSGKTTLLNALSQHMNIRQKTLVFSGSVEYLRENNKKINNSYMMQSDVFDAGLTVFETLKIQADLRMSPNVSEESKLHLIDSLLSILELTHLRNNVILGFWNAPSILSGGEKRRVSLAIALLAKPSILFLDEPTTGLDASSSLKLISMLKKLASPEIGITIILSIHQPRPEISILFDKICFLTRGGKMLFYGSLPEACSYFNDFGLIEKSDNNTNIVDYAMNLLVKDTSTKFNEEATSKKITKLVDNWKIYGKVNDIPQINEEKSKKIFENNMKLFSREKKEKIPFYQELKVLSKRSFLLSIRDKGTLFSFNGVSIILGLICGWLFYKPEPDLAGIRSITSALYVLLELIGFFPLLIEIERLWETEGVTFMREHQEGYVSIPGFIISRRLGKLFTEDLPVPIFFSCIVYFMWGLRIENNEGNSDASYFFIFLAIAILTNLISLSLAMVAFSVCKNFAISTFLLNINYQLQNLSCGYFVNASTMPVYVRWTKYISHFWYAFGALTSNQYHNWQGACPYESSSGLCDEYSGNYQLKVLGYPSNWIKEPICILLAWFVGFNILAIVFLYTKSYEMTIAKTKKNKIGGEDVDLEVNHAKTVLVSKKKGDKIETDSLGTNHNGYEINISDLTLTANEYNFIGKKTNSKDLLQRVTANFDAGKLNIIMGPSGSGKTTTLNYLSNRLSGKRKFTSQGGIYLNKTQKIDPETMGKISSYVAQHDNSLIANLTVRENLFYQAKLRLPIHEHNQIPTMIQSLLRKTGLIDCADRLIGSDLVKGISGGEKRRVSIAIQLLSSPKIIFLDEPTSGLDSKTSTAILSLLNNLCVENNTTIITTIHQPSAEMFNEFGSLLLLARGGKVVYNGDASKVSTYLSDIGFPNFNTNIADYILDLVTVGINETKEESQNRIDQMVNLWVGRKATSNINNLHCSVDFSSLIKQRLPLLSTFITLCRRQFLTTVRSTDVLIARGFQTVFVAVFVAIYFSPLKNTQGGISNRLGLIQETLNLYFVGFINNMSLFPYEKQLFFQEYRDGIYGVFEFNICYLLNEIPMELFTCCIYSILIVFACGLPRDASMFFTMFAGSFIAVNCGESLGMMIVSLFDHLGVAMNILNFCLFLAIFMGGTMSINMPDFFKGINFINPMKYIINTCAKLGFTNQEFSCYTSECTLDSGAKVLDYYNLDNNLGLAFMGLFICLFVYRLIATSLIWVRVKFFL